MNLIEERRVDETIRRDPGVSPFNDECPYYVYTEAFIFRHRLNDN